MKKINYHNSFLVLSLILIAGYFAGSLYYLNKMRDSGEEGEQYTSTIEKANAIFQHTILLENAAYNYIITKSSKESGKFEMEKAHLLDNLTLLDAHCVRYKFAQEDAKKLDFLIKEHILGLEGLVQKYGDTAIATTEEVKQLNFGKATLLKGQILSTLKSIRYKNQQKQEAIQKNLAETNQQTISLISVFGGIMLVIVIISFFKMREEIQRSRRLLKDIRNVNIELSSVNESLEQYAYVASHDLSEPLRKIQAFGEMIGEELKKESPDKKLISDYIQRMRTGADRMLLLMDDLLQYSRLSAGKLEKQKVDLNTVFAAVEDDLELKIKETKAKIKVDNLPENIQANPTQMHQLFLNLLGNALKFHKKGEPPIIVVTSKKIPRHLIPKKPILYPLASDYWKIEIKDNGIGFSPRYSEKIFGVFERLEGKEKFAGTGIGLSSCKKICEQHKGGIKALSEEGAGATFIVYLPEKE